jgi:hypothetical protein
MAERDALVAVDCFQRAGSQVRKGVRSWAPEAGPEEAELALVALHQLAQVVEIATAIVEGREPPPYEPVVPIPDG